ncbi:hypothetical protein BDV19DRAFT_378959 [Aspergillus venezuelensis]
MVNALFFASNIKEGAVSQVGLEGRLTFNQWKDLLRDLDIFKNIRNEDALRAKEILDQNPDGWHCLVFADNVLQENEETIKHCGRNKQGDTKRKERGASRKNKSDLRHITYALFKNFQCLLFAVKVHFETSFTTGRWVAYDKGLIAMGSEFQEQLATLSRMHNRVFYALKHFQEGNKARGDESLQDSFALHRSVVGYHHHRQLPNNIGILLMVWQAGNRDLQQSITDDLHRLAEAHLPQNDPRRMVLECLRQLKRDQIKPLYIALDALCRSLWMANAATQSVTAYISYSQTRFPRADAGEFYSIYRGRTRTAIEDVLTWADSAFEQYSHGKMLLWPTAMEYLMSEGRYEDTICFGQILDHRTARLGSQFDWNSDHRLNQNVSTTHLLLGLAYEAKGCLVSARSEFQKAARLRDEVIPGDKWDSTRKSAVDKLVETESRIGEVHTATYNRVLIEKMYSST